MPVLVFLGPPGAGKGTIAQRLSKELGVPRIGTGDILRESAQNDTAFGRMVKETMERGQYVDDETMAKIVENRLSRDDARNGFILDGFPRTVAQAMLLDEILKERGLKIDAVLLINASDETIVERLSGRRQCRKCGRVYHIKNIPPRVPGKCDECNTPLFQRADDKPGVVRERLRVYREKSFPLVDFYKGRALLREVDANGPVEENMCNVRRALRALGVV